MDDWLLHLAPPRVGPFREGAFGSRLHSERNAAWLGVSLGVTFTVCFVTGLLSHVIQHPPSWFLWPSRPAGLYRVTQGIHVATGIASIPLLLAKLWTVYPR
ncbi:MAG TPA: molybdopterin-binding protein, partial [Actinomycetota bacterium]